MRYYIIVGTQRSGSNYICAYLRSVPEFGFPIEYFNPVHIKSPLTPSQRIDDPHAFVETIVNNSKSTYYFGLKLHYIQFAECFRRNDIDILDIFPGAKIIFLRRSNIVQQAISLWKAEYSQQWTAEMPSVRTVYYDFNNIQARYFDLKIHDLLWQSYLSERCISFLNILYEDIIANDNKIIYQICAFLGRADLHPRLLKPKLKKQSDTQSMDWEKQFRRDYREREKENVDVWRQRTVALNAEMLGENPNVWRKF